MKCSGNSMRQSMSLARGLDFTEADRKNLNMGDNDLTKLKMVQHYNL